MKVSAIQLARQYALALREHLAHSGESGLQRAYELGRDTIASGLGVMDLAQAHEQAAAALPARAGIPADCARERALAFLLESLWAFEMMHRGFHEANRALRALNTALEDRARKLNSANRLLKGEIAERQRVEQALRQSEADLRKLSAQILTAQEEERKRISRELHDEVGQALTAINMSLTMLKGQTATRSTARGLGDLQKLLQETMERIHDFTRELRPAMLDHLGLLPALRSYVRNFQKRTGIPVRFRAAAEAESLGSEEKTVLYRVTQEGLTNVARHARAHSAAVLIRKTNGCICMEVRDDGRAFSTEDTLRTDGNARLGLVGIQERVRLVNGFFSIQSRPGRGTTIRVQIPVKSSGALVDSRYVPAGEFKQNSRA